MKKKLSMPLLVIIIVIVINISPITLNAAEINGTNSDDILVGTSKADTIYGKSGKDTIEGLGGNDILFGGNGTDFLFGNFGQDKIYGGEKKDTIMGGYGNDIIYGNQGTDIIYGDEGDDTINGNLGADIIYGKEDNDTIKGGYGNDTIYGNQGDDKLTGNQGSDKLYGNRANDIINGGLGDDTINGGLGNDTIRYKYHFGKKNNDILLEDPNGKDKLIINTTQNSSEVIFEQSGIDLLITLDSTNTVLIKNYYTNEWLEDIKVNGNDEQIKEPEILFFNVNFHDIKPGDTVVLSWDVKNASHITIEGLEKNVESKLPLNGTLEVWPFATTEYVLTAYSEDGESVYKSVKVNVHDSTETTPSVTSISTPSATAKPEKSIPTLAY